MTGKRASNANAELLPRLILLMVFFLIGAVIGSFFSANISDNSIKYVEDYLSREQETDQSGVATLSAAKKILIQDIVLLILVFASAFFKPGAVLIPLCLGIKGFLLSMLVTAFIMAQGVRGYVPAVVVIFAYGFLTVTSLVLLSVQAFNITLSRPAGRRGRPYIDRAYYLTACIAISATILVSVLHIYLTPLLSRAASAIIS